MKSDKSLKVAHQKDSIIPVEKEPAEMELLCWERHWTFRTAAKTKVDHIMPWNRWCEMVARGCEA
jgi:hypothetical protein